MTGILRIGQSWLVLVLGLAAWAVPHEKKDWPVPEEAKKLRNPVPPTEASLGAAKDLYAQKCTPCHGEAGKGDGPLAPMYQVKAADFTDAHMMGEMSDGEIFWKMSEGRPPMPSFKKQLTEEQRWQLVNYIRALTPKSAPAAKSTRPPAKKTPAPKH